MVKVLVVYDEPALREVLLLMLKQGGFLAEAVGNGSLALAELRRKSYDVIVLDLDMPVMGGMAFLKARALDAALFKIPVVVFSAREPVVIPGVFDWVEKPCLADELTAAIARAILR